MSANKQTYWKTFLGIPRYKIDWYFKYYLYKIFGFTFDKMNDQKEYWNTRGVEYYDDVFKTHLHNYEIFFQDMLIDELGKRDFSSFFEVGCGFGWNVKRVKKEFPSAKIGGLDFSMPQLYNSRKYSPDIYMPIVCGDGCIMPFKDKSFDVGFTLGVFMNIHPDKIDKAIDEMIRVSRKYIIHLEWDQKNTSHKLKERRVFKTNIVSHDYRGLYEKHGKRILKYETYQSFGAQFHQRYKSTKITTWEQYEGPEKYILIVIEV